LVLTPLSLRHFPMPEYQEVRESILGRESGRERERCASLRIPRLFHLLLDKVCANPQLRFHQSEPRKETLCSPQRVFEEEFERVLSTNIPFQFHREPVSDGRKSGRKSYSKPLIRKLFLGATLIALPRNLLDQWYTEIQKHCGDKVRVLVIHPNSRIPPARDLATNYEASVDLSGYCYYAYGKSFIHRLY